MTSPAPCRLGSGAKRTNCNVSPSPCSVISKIRRPARGKPFHWGMIGGRGVKFRFFQRHSYSAHP